MQPLEKALRQLPQQMPMYRHPPRAARGRAVPGQACTTRAAPQRGPPVRPRCMPGSPDTASNLIETTTELLVSKSPAAGWANFRSQPAFVQGLVWVFALPVAVWLWASACRSARAAAFCFAAILTLGCLAIPFLGGPTEESVRTTAAGNSTSDQTISPQPPKTTSPTSTPGQPTAAPATTPLTVPPTSPLATLPPVTSPPIMSPPAADSPSTQSGNAAQLLSQVSVRDETSDSGYDRDLFNHWIDANGDGCDTRCEVLKVERLPSVAGLSNSGWLSLYDGKVTDNPSEFDIDHLVALGEAWRSGASEWDGARRQAFANDLDDPRALIAVSASSNRSKSDRDPSSWQPPDKAYWCTYVTDWMAVKLKWGLAVDPIEFTALQSIVEAC